MTDRNKPGVAFWATVVLVVALAYPLSFAPACWLIRMEVLDLTVVAHAYRPVVDLGQASHPIASLATWYAGKDQWGVNMLSELAARLDDEERFGRGAP